MKKNKNESLIKTLDFSILFVFILLLVTGTLELPPSSYLISFYCEINEIESCNPFYITALTTLIYGLIIWFIKTKIIKPSTPILTIFLRRKHQKLIKSIFIMVIVYSLIMLKSSENNFNYLVGFIGLTITTLLIFCPMYILTFNKEGEGKYILDNLYNKKVIKNFDLESIKEISIKQLESKFFSAVLVLNNGDEIFLDSTPTKDKIQERIDKINEQLNRIKK